MAKVYGQTFDRVHDTQFIFRKLLDAMASPGKINSIQSSSEKLDFLSNETRMVASFALTLLDGEVSFAIQLPEKMLIQEYVQNNTFSRLSDVHDTDYLFLDGKISDEEVMSFIQQVKKGTLIQPESSTTLFILVEALSNTPSNDQLRLSGPGIKEEIICTVKGISDKWWKEREKANVEYPLGIDIILFTKEGEILALPRTTKIERGE